MWLTQIGIGTPVGKTGHNLTKQTHLTEIKLGRNKKGDLWCGDGDPGRRAGCGSDI